MATQSDRTPRTAERHPHERYTDQGWRGRMSHWWFDLRGYRDIWLILVTGIVLYATISSVNASDKAEHSATTAESVSRDNQRIIEDIQGSRRDSILTGCREDQVRDDLKRRILLDALGHSDDSVSAQRRRAFYEELFKPLGGLEPLTAEERRARCQQRVEDALSG